jgi:hypothetical protein
VRSRILTPLAVLLVAVLAAGCDAPTPYAAKVGDEEISDTMLNDHLDEWAASADLLQALQLSPEAVAGAAPNSWSMPYVDNILTTMVFFELQSQEFARRHLEVGTGIEDQIEQTLVGEATAQVWNDVSPEFKQYLIDAIAHQDAVQTALGDDYETWLRDQATRDDIEINPQYGSWSGTGGIVGPTGPQPGPNGT